MSLSNPVLAQTRYLDGKTRNPILSGHTSCGYGIQNHLNLTYAPCHVIVNNNPSQGWYQYITISNNGESIKVGLPASKSQWYLKIADRWFSVTNHNLTDGVCFDGNVEGNTFVVCLAYN